MKAPWTFDEIIDRSNTSSMKWEPDVLKAKFGKNRQNLLPFWVADMDFQCPDVIYKAMEDRLNHKVFGYTIHDKGQNTALIDWFNRRHNWEIKEKWIVNTPGIVPGVNYLIQCFTKPGDKVIIQTPVYYPFASAIKNNGRQVLENPLKLNGTLYEMDFDDLSEKVTDPRVKLAILCSPHNPVGRVWTKEELTTFGKTCLDNNVLVFADEIHCDLVMPGFTHTSYQTLSEELALGSIAGNAASKTFNLAGLSHSSLIVPNGKLRDEIGIYFETLGLNPRGSSNLFGAVASRAAYEGAEPWLDDLIAYLYGNYIYLKKRIESELPGVHVYDMEATYLPWIDFRHLGLLPEEIIKIVEETAGVALDHGDWFGDNGAGFERINIACPRKLLEKAVSLLIKAFKPYC
ncbi:MAG: pyridoxal phosphate-dependent aminotransferase [Desulfobacterales bacterium]|nr:pyridoxal phosphate-dependent aminotransferase [Desulfobacterales bacterium]